MKGGNLFSLRAAMITTEMNSYYRLATPGLCVVSSSRLRMAKHGSDESQSLVNEINPLEK